MKCFLEDKLWSDNPNRDDLLIWWAGLEGGDAHMSDHHHFMRDLIGVRRRQPALRSDPVNVYLSDNTNRVLAFHRWTPEGDDVVVVASLSESTFTRGSYALGFPLPGFWFEVLNSDVYDNFPNPSAAGNAGHVIANGQPLHGQPASAGLTIPANSVLVFAREPAEHEAAG
jgi:1,4-alpha-glucan branching enzyme